MVHCWVCHLSCVKSSLLCLSPYTALSARTLLNPPVSYVKFSVLCFPPCCPAHTHLGAHGSLLGLPLVMCEVLTALPSSLQPYLQCPEYQQYSVCHLLCMKCSMLCFPPYCPTHTPMSAYGSPLGLPLVMCAVLTALPFSLYCPECQR
eukprot:1134840-Pelagomonas_calceolata.AAC.2